MFAIIGMELSKQPRQLPKEQKTVANPEILGAWSNLIARPRAIAVHPTSGEVVIAGFANYGMVGGGFGIHDLKSGKNREISDWLKNIHLYTLYDQETFF